MSSAVPATPEAYWTIARTDLNSERKAARFLGLAKFETYLPFVKERRITCGRIWYQERPLWPNYILIRIVSGFWWNARWCVGVSAILRGGADGHPAKLADSVVDEIRAREQSGVVVLPEKPRFKRGDSIKVIAGPFSGHAGLYEGQKGSERVLVLLRLFNTQRAIDLPMDAIVEIG
jgi:transcription antitermination factor NusG